MGAALHLPSQADLDREQVRRKGLAEFVRRAWPQVDTSPLVWGWHIDAIAEHLEAVQRREVTDLVINLPPGLAKSLLVSVLFPAWVWTHDPAHRWIAASYDRDLALRDARKHRALVGSDWYRARWPTVQLPPARDVSTAVGFWANTLGGVRYSVTVRGGVTGKHADTALVDDPIDPGGASAASGVELDAVLAWWRETLPTRFRDPPRSARVLVMQRLHERDLAAEMIRGGATVLCLPMRYERAHPHAWRRDPRATEGELIAPARYPEAVVQRLERTLGPTATAAQFQQRPSPAGGAVFRAEWLQRAWLELPPGGTYAQSWDLAFKDAADSSYVVGQVWYQQGASFYLVDQVRERLDFARTLDAIRALTARWPKAVKKLIEAKANGPAVASALKREIPGVVLVEPDGGKLSRAHAVEALFAAGNVLLPDPARARYDDGSRAAWLPAYVAELLAFPNGLNDDQVDATTQYLNHSAPRLAERLKQAMASVFGAKP